MFQGAESQSASRILLKVAHLLPCFFRTLFQLFLSFLGLFDLKQMRTKGCWHEASPDEFGLCCWTESALLTVVLQQFLTHTISIQERLMLWPEAGTTRSSSSIFCRLAFSSSFSDSSASWRFLHVSWRINATGRNYSDDEHTMDLARSVRKKKTGNSVNLTTFHDSTAKKCSKWTKSVLLQVQQNQHIFVAVKLFPFQSTFDPNLTSENWREISSKPQNHISSCFTHSFGHFRATKTLSLQFV